MEDTGTFFDRLPHVVDGVGTPGFYTRVCKFLSHLTQWDARMVMRYSKSAKPDYLWAENLPEADIELYLLKFYRLDPFFAYWRAHDQPAVLRMSDTPLSRRRRSNYFRIFQRVTGFRDGLGIFLPTAQNDAIAICYECRDRIPDSVVELCSRMLPALQSLQSLHVRLEKDPVSLAHAEAGQAEPPADVDHIAENFLAGQLTPREREIVLMSLEGTSVPEIADQLGLSEGTVRNHRKRLYKKLGIFSERELLALYIRHLSAAL